MSTSTIPVTEWEQRALDAIERRVDSIGPAITAISRAAVWLPPADQLYVQRRLREIGVGLEDDHDHKRSRRGQWDVAQPRVHG